MPVQTQTLCVKLLIGVTENLIVQNSKYEARKYLIQILESFAFRLEALKEIQPLCHKFHEVRKPSEMDSNYSDLQKIETYIDVGYVQPIRTTAKPLQHVPDLVKDFRLQFKSILIGIKAVLSHISVIVGPESSKMSLLAFAEESELIARIFTYGVDCFAYYFVDPETGESKAAQKEDKDVVDAFANIFTSIDLAMFQETCCDNIGHLFGRIEINPYVLAIPQAFLTAKTLSPHYSGPLLTYLMNNFDEIGEADTSKATVMLRLFKLLFNALTMYPEDNELVFQPHLANIIMKSLKTNAKDPINYFLLLRGLFRSIGGGKFEALYREVLPLLQVLLETLNFLLLSSHKQQMRELFVELCLTVPVRLSVLLPHLSYLMRPLTIALHAGPDLVSQSLKTLELCIDNLNQEFLEPIFAPVIEELMIALWGQLKPLPFNRLHSVTSLRILGKFGGRNRRLLNDLSKLSITSSTEPCLSVAVSYYGSEELHSLTLDKSLATAKKLLQDSASQPRALQDAFELLRSCTPLFFDANIIDNDLKFTVHELLKKFKSEALNWSETGNSSTLEAFDSASPFPEIRDTGRNGRLSLEAAASDWMQSVFIACSHEVIHSDAWELAESIVRHFVLISIEETIGSKRPDISQGKQGYDVLSFYANSKVTPFVQAVVNCLSDHNIKSRESAERVFLYFHEVSVSLIGSSKEAENVLAFRIFANTFEVYCYKAEWLKKSGACHGISLLCMPKLDFGLSWMLDHELEFVKALLFILKDTTTEVPYFETAKVTETLSTILSRCNTGMDMFDSFFASKFNSLIVVLISELSNSNPLVRSTVQNALKLLADCGNVTVTDLLMPVTDKLLYPIFAKPLRALPFAMQIGNIDAVTYCLNLKPSLITFSEELGRLLQEALALAEAEEQTLSNKDNQYKNASALNTLRVQCIQLLSSVMHLPEISTPKLLTTKNRIIQLFFKCLYSKSPEVIKVANSGLTDVLGQNQRLPKDLLQVGLKPILVNLSDFQRLTVAGLNGLQRLLELLTHYFKVEIGRKLLDHLKQWADPNTLRELSGKYLKDSKPVLIIAAILDVFYLLPPAANIFMDELVKQVIDLEILIKRTASSPFRAPLVRYLNRYSEEAFTYFMEKFENPSFTMLFIKLLELDIAGPLREETMKNTVILNEKLFNFTNRDGDNSQNALFCGVYLLSTLAKQNPTWFFENEDAQEFLLDIWKSNERILTDPYQNNLLYFYVARLLLLRHENDPSQVSLFFEIMIGLRHPFLTDTTFLRRYLSKMVFQCDESQCNVVMAYFLEQMAKNEMTLSQKATVSRFYIIPMLMNQPPSLLAEIFTKKMITKILHYIWEPNDDEMMAFDQLKLEMIQFTTLLVYQVPGALTDHLKQIIKYAWGFLKTEDSVLKEAACVLLCRFIRESDTPVRIVTQTYVSQLRAHQSEIRPMVKQALDSLLPALPGHEGMNSVASNGIPLWVGWISRTIVEDGSLPQLISIYQLILRNETVIYRNRKHLLQQIISSLSRLGLAGNATTETKILSAELSQLLLKWEKRSIEEAKELMDIDDSESSKINEDSRELIVSFLVRFCLSLNDEKGTSLFAQGCENLKEFYLIWPSVVINLTQLCKIGCMELTDANLSYVMNAANILMISAECKSSIWVVENLGSIQLCLEKWMSSESEQLFPPFNGLLRRVCDALNSVEFQSFGVSERQGFINAMDVRLKERLKSASSFSFVASVLNAVYFNYINKPTIAALVREHIMELMNLVGMLVVDGSNLVTKSDGVETILRILNHQITHLGDMRKNFFTIIFQIIDNPQASQLHKVLLDILRVWTLGAQREAFPTLKEKCGVAAKLVALQNYNDTALFDDYMSLVADIYENQSLARTELTVRLEPIFLAGTKLNNMDLRDRFLSILDISLPEKVSLRLSYILGGQNWDSLADSFWITQAVGILLGSIQPEALYNSNQGHRIPFIKQLSHTRSGTKRNLALDEFTTKHNAFLMAVRQLPVLSLISSIKKIIQNDTQLSYDLWISLFTSSWNSLKNAEKHDLVKSMIILVAKEYHAPQADLRPNVIQALLEGSCRCSPPIQLPPQLVKYLGKTYNAWHLAIQLLENTILEEKSLLGSNSKEEEKVKDAFFDALADLYNELDEQDYFGGLWRRRCLFLETNAAISSEQTGKWDDAQRFYEMAQTKARSCVLPFSESEYNLWESRWVSVTERLQQWDILCDLSKHDSKPDLLLECAWRLSDWSSDRDNIGMTLQSVAFPPTPRKKLFKAYLVLNKLGDGPDAADEFQRLWDEGAQLVLKKWHSLPKVSASSHTPIFHQFQQYVELHEASLIQNILRSTSTANIETKSQELKNYLSTWRDRLPNTWDDMNIWSDLVAWRQNVFTSINNAYLPLIPHISSTNSTPTSSYAYRGYHETAWIINRFAHVARKHRLADICISSLSKIYTLPNIEIQEAFYKLREQAKCHTEVLSEYSAALDVINNTNLLYFTTGQKAEFFNLRGTFYARLNLKEKALEEFSTAIQTEPNLPHSWASFGEYNDKLFDDNPTEISLASDAVNCYLHASSIFNNGRCRRMLSRILWLLSLDDEAGTIMDACNNFKGDPPVWYWISFIPELIGSLAGREAKFARNILMRIAKVFPQALHFQLRSAKEDFTALKRQQSSPVKENEDNDMVMDINDNENEEKSQEPMPPEPESVAGSKKQVSPWENIEDIMAILKTAFPLLALTMETLVDQILARLKPSTDEDIYRLIVALLNDGIQAYLLN